MTVTIEYDGLELHIQGQTIEAGERLSLRIGTIEYRYEQKTGRRYLVWLSDSHSDGREVAKRTLTLDSPGIYRLGSDQAYRVEGQDPVLRLVKNWDIPLYKIEEVNSISAVKFLQGGLNCYHQAVDLSWQDAEWGAPAHATIEMVEEGDFPPPDHFIVGHRHCKITPDLVTIRGVSAAAQFIWQRDNGIPTRYIERLYVERSAPREVAAHELETVLEMAPD